MKDIVDSAVPMLMPAVFMENADYLLKSLTEDDRMDVYSTLNEDGGGKLPEHVDRPEMSGCTLVEVDPSSVIDDAVLADVIRHNEPSCATEVNQSMGTKFPDQHGEILTLDQLIDASIARDKLAVKPPGDQGRTALGFVPSSFNRQVKPKAVMRLFWHTKPVTKAISGQLNATFDRRRQAALQSNGRVISSMVDELQSMAMSNSMILKESDNSAIDQLRKMDKMSTVAA